MTAQRDQSLWDHITGQVDAEWRALPAGERDWIRRHALEIIGLQQQLHRLFLDVKGADICRNCRGDCCGHGKYHPNLTNLLACLVAGIPVPAPDFGRDCPYIGAEGCLFPPGLRPYNCISFICEEIEDRLGAADRDRFYSLEKLIRAEYELFTRRYVGAGLNGILIRGEKAPAYLARR